MGNLKHFMDSSALVEAFVEMRKYYAEVQAIADADSSPFISKEQIYEAEQLVEGGFYAFVGRMMKLATPVERGDAE